MKFYRLSRELREAIEEIEEPPGKEVEVTDLLQHGSSVREQTAILQELCDLEDKGVVTMRGGKLTINYSVKMRKMQQAQAENKAGTEQDTRMPDSGPYGERTQKRMRRHGADETR